MKIVIFTQYRENYGAHDWDGKGECPQYWKNKGGAIFVIENITDQDVKIQLDNVPVLKSLIEYQNPTSSENILDVEVVDDDAEVSDPWDQPWVLSFVDNEWHATKVTNNDEYSGFHHRPDILNKIETYILAVNGQHKKFTSVFNTVDGKKLDWQGNEVK